MAIAKVYVASKTRWAQFWQDWRAEWAPMGLHVTSTWIDQAGEGQSDMTQLWQDIVEQVRDCDFLIAYHAMGDQWKGTYAEIGMALAFGKPVYFSGSMPPGTLHHHPLVTISDGPDDAVEDFRAFHLQREWR